MSRLGRGLARQAAANPALAPGAAPALAQYGLALGTGPGLPRPAQAFQSQFGPMMPIMPFGIDKPKDGQRYPEPRIWEYPVGYNLPTHPGDLKLVSFANLRRYADTYDVARRAIEVRKTEIASLDWDIVIDPRQVKRAGKDAFKAEREELRQFWRQPDRNYFDLCAWLKAILEDFLVIDAVSIYPVRARGKGWFGSGVAEFRLLDGSTIKPLLDVTGGIPRPPAPAYQQYLWGVPRLDLASLLAGGDVDLGEPAGEYTTSDLLYLMLNARSFTPYGFSNTEQAIVTILTAMRRKEWMLSYFDDGSVPALFVEMPSQADWTPEQIEQRERNLNEIIAATMAEKWRIKFLPPGAKANPMKPPVLSSDFDELLVKTVCMCYDVTPMELGFEPRMGLGGKGFADNQEQAQYRKSIRPTANFLESVFNRINHQLFGMPEELLFRFVGLDPVEDEERRAAIDVQRIGVGVLSPDEARENNGMEAWGLPETKEPLIITPAGPVFLVDALQQSRAQAQRSIAGQPEPGAPGTGAPPPAGAQDGQGDDTKAGDVKGGDDQPGGQQDPPTKPDPQAQKDELKALAAFLDRRAWSPGRPFAAKALTTRQVAVASASPALLARVRKAVEADASDRDALDDLAADAAPVVAALVRRSDPLLHDATVAAVLAALTKAYGAAYARGAARWGMAPPADDPFPHDLAQQQRRFLAGFLDDAPDRSAAQVAARAAQYAGLVHHAYMQGKRRYAPQGTRWRWEASAKACDDCADRSGHVYSEADLPGVPGDGSTICHGRCRCVLSPVFPDEPDYDE